MKSTTGLELETISKSGVVPESRLNTAVDVQHMVKQVIRADDQRAKVRAKLKGLVDGNPPYSTSELRRTGQSYRTNVNFREAESFLNMALSSFYDVFADVATYSTVKIKHGTEADSKDISNIVTDEFDKLLKGDDDFDYLMQLSQHEMVLYGIGPMIFDGDVDWRCKAVKASNLLVPDGTKSNVNDWTVCVIRASYQVHELYSFIRDEESAKKAGWNISQARKAIIEASPEDYLSNEHAWEWYQQQIRNNDLAFSAKCDVVRVNHVYYREFPCDSDPEGAISHCIINERGEAKDFLFRKVKRYKKWDEVVHCLYYDKGDGLHHSVKGMGVKMYSTLELKNRLKCTMVDASVARSAIHLIPDSANAMNRINVMNLGPYSILPPNMSVQQTSMAGAMDAPMLMDEKLEGGIQANLTQYRQRLEKDGNPRTATEIEAIMSQQSTLGRTQISRYYQQLDALFAEKYRRAINSNLTKDRPGGAAALKFQKACRDRGVTVAILKKFTRVQASRSAGRGSQFAKQAVMNQLMGLIGMLPEGGRQNVIRDTIAATAGYDSLEIYFPEPVKDVHTDEEQQHAAYENILFKTGGIIPVSSGDNHAIHAGAHLQAGMELAQAVNDDESIDAMGVATFLRAMLEHVHGHMAELSEDPTREELLKALHGHYTELTALLDDMMDAMNEQAQAAEEEGTEAGEGMANLEEGGDPKEQLAQAKFEREEARRDAKNEADIERKAAKARQDLALKDAKTAAKIMAGKDAS